MGFVFQAFHILPYLSVAQNVALPLSLLGVRGNAADARVAAMLASVGLADRAASMPRELSGGELQRIAIARALVHRPQLVLIDEPTGNLDPDSAQQVLALLHDRIKENAAAGILVTHSRSAAAPPIGFCADAATDCAMRHRTPARGLHVSHDLLTPARYFAARSRRTRRARSLSVLAIATGRGAGLCGAAHQSSRRQRARARRADALGRRRSRSARSARRL